MLRIFGVEAEQVDGPVNSRTVGWFVSTVPQASGFLGEANGEKAPSAHLMPGLPYGSTP